MEPKKFSFLYQMYSFYTKAINYKASIKQLFKLTLYKSSSYLKQNSLPFKTGDRSELQS